MARRVLKMLEMEEEYEGNVEVFDGFNLLIPYIYNHIHILIVCVITVRQLGRTIQLNLLKPGGPSVLSLTLVF